MCGIGGFSLSADSKIHPRQLANAMLTALEDRGYMASGVAWQTRDGSNGYYKDAINGSSLKLKRMPKSASTVICHTRLATHGSTSDNRNNHPVLSPERSIALVHNGVIYNHTTVRASLPDIDFDVDTAVIPALIEADGSLERLRELDGDAAIAWLSDGAHGTLHLARLEHSPMVIAQVEDGSFVFASTEQLLWRVLIQLDLVPEFMQTIEQYTHLRVVDGVITDWQSLGASTAVSSYYDYGHYRHLTAGGKPKASSAYSAYGSEYDPYWSDKYDGTPKPYGSYEDWDDDDYEALSWNASFNVEPPKVERSRSASEYYIQYQMSIHSEPHYIWYAEQEYGDWEQDIYLFQNDNHNYRLFDYGSVAANGLLQSEMPGNPNISCSLDNVV
jgi:predicted glutamine amidotransferase